MPFKVLTLAVFALMLAGAPAHAVDAAAATELAKSNGCLSCHAAHDKVVGPSYAAIAAKYKDNKDAVAGLVQSIQYGSKGKWGRIPMPPHPSMSAADIQTLAEWVLTVR